MRLAEPTAAPRRPSTVQLAALGAVIAAGVAGFVLVQAGVVALPDVEGALTDLSETLGAWTYVLVAGLAFLETGAFVGLVAPGETAIVLGGVVAERGEVSLPLVVLVAWLTAAAGDVASFMLGRRLGRPFLVARGARLGVTPARLAQVERFFDRHGPKAILAGRFIGIVRAVAPFLAGSSDMRLRAFVPWSLLGTFVWATTFTLVGYAFSESFGTAADTAAHAGFGVAALGAGVLVIRRLQLRRRVSGSPDR